MTKVLKRHKVWDKTTRVFHWLNAICVFSLLVLGLFLMNTGLFGIQGDGKILLKTIHVYIGYVFTINLAWRLVWAFTGSHFARWKQFLPVGKGYLSSLTAYLAGLRSGNPPYLGHNPVARLIIGLFFLLLSLQTITGLVLAGTDLYKPPLGQYIAKWVTENDPVLMDNLKPGNKTHVIESAYKEMRVFREPFIETHEFGFYVLLVLILLHIGGVMVTEIREKNGIVSAMITGEKVFDEEPVDRSNRINFKEKR